MLTIGDLREILNGLSDDLTDDTPVYFDDGCEFNEISSVLVGPLCHATYYTFFVEKEDYFYAEDAEEEEYETDMAEAEPALVLSVQ